MGVRVTCLRASRIDNVTPPKRIMSLRVKHLNADSSFLLIFTPPLHAALTDRQGTFPGSFTILVDPWLAPAASTIFHKRFACTSRRVPACVDSLADLPEPDAILVSQDKPDHCHRETLCSLPPHTRATIYAVPAAAKKIRSWKHFDPAQVVALPRFDDHRDESVFRIPIPAYSLTGQPGEISIANMAPKLDVTGLHQAIGITYRPPSSPLSSNHTTTHLDLPVALPSPPSTPLLSGSPQSARRASFLSRGSLSSLRSAVRRHAHDTASTPPVTPPLTDSSVSFASVSTMTISSPVLTKPSNHREKAISVLYSPHGLAYEHIEPWVSGHLFHEGALPLTALFHGLERSGNPWYFGGNILAGAENGINVALALHARRWFIAHDEEKENSGISIRTLTTKRYPRDEVRNMMAAQSKHRPLATELLDLESGEEYVIPPS